MNTKFTIRKAELGDEEAIHLAHMKSIMEVCSKDHTEEEVNGWGKRPFLKEQRTEAITKHHVYVVVIKNKIEGFLDFTILENKNAAYVFALYLTEKTIGHGAGKELMKIVFDTCNKTFVEKIELHSTITAHEFYRKMGFSDSGPMTSVLVNQVQVRCTPMVKFLSNFSIRKAQINEAETLSNLALISKAHWPYPKDYLDKCVDAIKITGDYIEEWPVYVSELNGEVVGFYTLKNIKGENRLDNLWILPKFIKFKIGTRLFQHAINTAKDLKWDSFFIAAEPYAIGFYEKMGAVKIGEVQSRIKPDLFLPHMVFKIIE